MNLLPDYTEIDRLRAEVDRLTAELAKAELHRDTYRDAWQTVVAEIAELRAQEPVGYVREWEGDDSDLGSMLFETEKNELDDNPNWQPVFARPVPAAQAVPDLADILLRLESVLCGQDGRAGIHGSSADLAAVDAALDDIRALLPAERLGMF